MAESASGQDEASPVFQLATERVRQAHLTPSGFPAVVQQEQVVFLGI